MGPLPHVAKRSKTGIYDYGKFGACAPLGQAQRRHDGAKRRSNLLIEHFGTRQVLDKRKPGEGTNLPGVDCKQLKDLQ